MSRLLLSPRGRIDRPTFWLGWILPAVVGLAWMMGWTAPYGIYLALLALYPSACLFAKRMRDAGIPVWLAAPVWLAIFVLGAVGGYVYMFMLVLAKLTGWPGGTGVTDFGDMGGLYAIAGATAIFLVFSGLVGSAPAGYFKRAKLAAA